MKGSVRRAVLSFAVITGNLIPQLSHAAAEPTQGDKVGPTVEQWMSLKSADSPRISPDGRGVAYLIQEANWEANAFEWEIWIARIATGERYQLTDSKGSSWNPRWAPDGRRLAFLSNRDGGTQIYLVSPPGREAARLTQADNGVNDFQWSPDGRSIAFTTSEVLPRPGGEEPKEYHVVGNDPAFTSSLWVIAAAAEGPSAAIPPERLTEGAAFAVDDFSWAPDSRRIAFSANKYDAPYPFWTYDIYVLHLADKAVRKVVDTTGPDFFPVWSPDGRQIAYRTYVRSDEEEYFTYSSGYIAVVPAGGGPSRILTEQFDENPTPLAWSPGGIYFAARQKTYQHLFLLTPATGAIERVSEPSASIAFSFSFTSDFRQAAFVGADAKTYQEIYVSALRPFKPRRLTAMNEQLKAWKISAREVIGWKSKDGEPIEGVLIKPPGFDPSKKYPLVVILHTGPLEVDQPTITRDLPYPAELFAQKGALVLRPNYRGSIGYGAGFRKLLVGYLGIGQYWDVITGVDHLIAQGFVDPNRVGAMGWSHGGYITAFITTYSDRFRAATVGQGTSDWRIFYTVGAGSSVKPGPTNPTPWDDPEGYRKASPLTYVRQAKTPTLIQHGEADRIAPIVGAHELYRALKDQGVPVRMIIYKGAGHLPAGLKQTRAVVEHNFDWFRKWLWNE